MIEPNLSRAELDAMGFKSLGSDVTISRRASIHGAGRIAIGNHVRIDDFSVLTGGDGIVLGNFVHIACYCALFGGSGIVMRDFTGLSARVTIYSESDDYSGHSLTNPIVPEHYKPTLKKGRVTLEKHAIVGANSTLLPGITLEEGAAVGAHSLVTKSCEPWWIYFGVPAKKLRRRSRELLEFEKQFLETRA
jgi:dTDP-4-amino-4,6-dideoxy-D-glucose acyltransferase